MTEGVLHIESGDLDPSLNMNYVTSDKYIPRPKFQVIQRLKSVAPDFREARILGRQESF